MSLFLTNEQGRRVPNAATPKDKFFLSFLLLLLLFTRLMTSKLVFFLYNFNEGLNYLCITSNWAGVKHSKTPPEREKLNLIRSGYSFCIC